MKLDHYECEGQLSMLTRLIRWTLWVFVTIHTVRTVVEAFGLRAKDLRLIVSGALIAVLNWTGHSGTE